MSSVHSSSSDTEVATIILAAGSSSRLPYHKALLPIGKNKAIRHVAETALASRSSRVIVVLGARFETISAELTDLPLEIVQNRDYATGRTGSLKCALQYLGSARSKTEPQCASRFLGAATALQEDYRIETNGPAVIVFPLDCPFVSYRLLDELIDCFLEARKTTAQSLWVVPVFHGRRGHPILLGGSILEHIYFLEDNFPLREFLNHAKYNERLLLQIELACDSATVLDNINNSEDVRRLFEREGFICSALPS